MTSSSYPAIVVVGPTGSGKSDLALRLAERFRGEIVNYDSVQVYRGLDVGSAKVPPALRRGVAHHLLEAIDVTEELTAGSYARLARKVLADIRNRGRLPLLVGGTGFYLRALLDGLSPAPLRNEELRGRLRQVSETSPLALHRFLRRFDPETAARIHPNDWQKLIRAVEMTLLARKPASATQDAPREPLIGFRALKVGLDPPRHQLYARLNERTAHMFEAGLLEETQQLVSQGLSAGSKPLMSLGYKQAVQYLAGTTSLEEAVLSCQTRTRQYAKRQITWFRRESDVHWFTGFGTDKEVETEIMELVTVFLSSTFEMHLFVSEHPS